MLAKNTSIIFFLLLSIVLYFVYDWLKIPEGIAPKGDSTVMVATLALITSIVTLLTAIVGLIQKLIELNKDKNDSVK